jgi:2,5-diketo-D-gluconate reductase A
MEKPAKELKRREFIKTGATFAAATFLTATGGSGLFNTLLGGTLNQSVPAVKLNNGLIMPMLGFGTNSLNGAVGVRSVADAISVGYRLIDTATVYRNEEFVGEGIKNSGIKREELFITTKLWVDDSGYESAKKAFETSINKLGVNYLDLWLYHRPRGDVKGSWKAMEELYRAGKIKAIGISNFEQHHIDELMTYATIKPAVNQVETHVFFQQQPAYDSMKSADIQMQAWSPFAAGRNNVFSNSTLATIGRKYNKTNAQVSLRWLFQRGIIAIPRSSQKAHMIENMNIWDFELDTADMQTIATLDLKRTQFPEWN